MHKSFSEMFHTHFPSLFSIEKNHPDNAAPTRRHLFIGLLFAIILLGATVAIAWLSTEFNPPTPLPRQPILWLIGILIASGLVYFGLLKILSGWQTSPLVMITMLSLGLLMRLSMFTSIPILEDDFYRYLWDGAVTTHGINPYAYSPEDIRQAAEAHRSGEIPPELIHLSRAPGSTLGDINHAYVRSIYPPITQAAFALAYRISPWNIDGWRFLLLVIDLINLGLLLFLLKQANHSPLAVAIYWLNPLLIKEIFNSGHMDILIFPFLLSAFYFLLRQKHYPAMVFLAGAVGVKLWPLLLLPLFLRQVMPNYRKITGLLVLFGGITVLLLFPMLRTGLDANSGLGAYSQRWELNDAAFRLLVFGWQPLLKLIGIHPGYSQIYARITTAILLVGWAVLMSKNSPGNMNAFFNRALLIAAAIFLLSPTQFPWYAVWLLPFLTFVPYRSLLLLTVLLPLYYLWHYLRAHGVENIFHYGIVWIEFLPVWILLIIELRKKRETLLSVH